MGALQMANRLSALSTILKKVEKDHTLHSNKKQAIEIRIAMSTFDRVNCFQLAYDEYLKKQYIEKNAYGMLISPRDLCPNNVVISAYIGENIAGTLTVNCKEVYDEKLPYEETFSEIVSETIKGKKISEITRLAISDSFKNQKDLLQALFNASFIVARDLQKTHGFVIEVNPRHVKFYEKYLGFINLGLSKECERVNGATAELLWIDFNFEEEYRQKFNYFLTEADEERLFKKFREEISKGEEFEKSSQLLKGILQRF